MSNEKEKIVSMLETGKISAEDAVRLLAVLGEGDESKPKASVNPELKGRKLRVIVDGSVDDLENIKVNVAVPLALAKIADGIINNVIPKEVSKELVREGIDLSALNIGGIVDSLTDLDEDIVNVDMEKEGKGFKVRVYVE
jgi:hypothetical protein